MISRCYINTHLTLSTIGILFGLSAFIVFGWVKINPAACAWALFSGIVAGICLNLHYRQWQQRMAEFYAESHLFALSGLGFVIGMMGTAFCVWYIFSTVYFHVPMVPIEKSTAIPAVWAFMTSKWGFTLWWVCGKYRRVMEYNSL